MFFLCSLSILTYALLSIIAVVYAKKKSAFFATDILQPFIMISLWIFLAALGIGHQSLSHMIEIPLLLAISLVILYLRVFLIDRYFSNYRKNSLVAFICMLLLTILIRVFMPYLPE